MKKQAFTLVELIVVIIILAILGTIAFISLQGYSRDTRDSVRISDLKTIEKGLELSLLKNGKIIKPDSKINITASGELIAYQGYIGTGVLGSIGLSKAKDPLDQTYYTMMTNKDLTNYQLLLYLESGEEITKNILNETNALDLSNRYIFTKGDGLGILINSGSLIPLQDGNRDIDIVNTMESYTILIDNEFIFTGTGAKLKYLFVGVDNSSCKSILANNSYTKNIDGLYKIKMDGGNLENIYCDMTADGGGWSLISSDNDDGSYWGYGLPSGLETRSAKFDTKIEAEEIRHYSIVDDIHRDVIFDFYGTGSINEIDRLIRILNGTAKDTDYYSDIHRRNSENKIFEGKFTENTKNFNSFFGNIQSHGSRSVGIDIRESHYNSYINELTDRIIGRFCIYNTIQKSPDCFVFGSFDDNRVKGDRYQPTNTNVNFSVRKQYTFLR